MSQRPGQPAGNVTGDFLLSQRCGMHAVCSQRDKDIPQIDHGNVRCQNVLTDPLQPPVQGRTGGLWRNHRHHWPQCLQPLHQLPVFRAKMGCQLFGVIGSQKEKGQIRRTGKGNAGCQGVFPGVGQKGLNGGAGAAIVLEPDARQLLFQQRRPGKSYRILQSPAFGDGISDAPDGVNARGGGPGSCRLPESCLCRQESCVTDFRWYGS